MLQDEIVSYDVAKLAKDNGFPQHIGNDAYIVEDEYDDEYEVGCHYPTQFIPDYLPTISAPTQSLLQRWLREEKGLILIIRFDPSEQMYDWGVFLKTQPIEFTASEEYFEKYELALEDALKYALKNLI